MKKRFQPNDTVAAWRSWYSQPHAALPELSPEEFDKTALGREQSIAFLLKQFDATVKHVDDTMAMLRRRKLSQRDRGCLERTLKIFFKIAQGTLHDLAWYSFTPGPNQGSTGNTATDGESSGG